jgi:hypothetical protein
MGSIGCTKQHTICCGSPKLACTLGLRGFKLPLMSEQTRPNGQARPDDQTRPDEDQTQPGDHKATRRRVSVREAAQLLNTSVEGVRSRIKRGSLDSMRVQGAVYVLLSPDQIAQEGSKSDQACPDDRAQPGAQASPDAALYRLLDEQGAMIDWLKREVERKDTIIMSMAQRIPEIEAPRDSPGPEPRDASETAAEFEPGNQAPASDAAQPRRSWWRRFFGFE